MYKNKSSDGKNNICGIRIKGLRQSLPEKTSQRRFAEILQREGIDIDKNAVQRIESGQRFITDIELKILSKALHVTCDELLENKI